jgi:pimeloyl-ACP methyl ester carboxylesterase
MITHTVIKIADGQIHSALSGTSSNPAILFLHGWPENWKSYEKLIELAGESYFAVAIDLPGIGDSLVPAAPFLKVEIAKLVHKIVETMNLEDLTLVGHDVGGQVAFSYLHEYPNKLRAAVILDVVIPGLRPWDEVLRNPYLWHFAFHSIPRLPEIVVTGKEKEYFEYFYNAIAAHPERITPQAKEAYIQAYSRPDSLTTGFNWYRGFSDDAKYNKMLIEQGRTITTPVLYMRGDQSSGNIDQYAAGFADAGLRNLKTRIVPDSGHFMAEEQPTYVWKSILEFMTNELGPGFRKPA